MIRLYRALTQLVRVRFPAGAAGVSTWLVCLLKRVPATVGGFFLFLYVYGPAYQRYRGTFVAVRAWYLALSRRARPPEVRLGHPRRGRWDPRLFGLARRPRPVWRFAPAEVPADLFDGERYSLESAFPVVTDELFQEYAHEYFDGQQDLDTFQDDEPHDDGDHLWGTHEPVWGVDETTTVERDRFRRLATREALDREEYYLLDEPVDSFRTRPRRGGLARLVTPGDGPAVEDEEDQPDFGFSGWDRLADWHHYRVIPTRITQSPPVWGDFSYLLYEHRQSWRVDPTGRPAGWYRGGRGLVPWLHRTRRRRWTGTRWRIQRYYRLLHGGHRTWQTRRLRRRRRDPAGRDRRWRRPNLVPGAFAMDLFGGAPNRWNLARAAGRLAQRARRFRSAWVWARRRRPPGRPASHLSGRPVRDPRPGDLYRGAFARATGWSGRSRPRLAGWHAPRYHPVYDRNRRLAGALPGTSPGAPPVGAAWVVALFVGVAAVGAAVTAAVGYLSYFSPVGEDPMYPVDYHGVLVDPAWRPDFFRRVLEDLPTPAEVRRGDPRGRVTTRGYNLWTRPVGRHWRDNPGVDPGLLAETYNRAHRTTLAYDMWWINGRDEIMLSFNRRISVDQRGLFFWHTGWRVPSWLHMDGVVGTEWLHDPNFRGIIGQIEPLTWRRELDHRYNHYMALGPIINNHLLDGEVEGGVDELMNRWHHYHRQEVLRHLLVLPEWVDRADRRFHLDYGGYWSVLTTAAAWPSSSHLDLWSAHWGVGNSDGIDRIHRSVFVRSEGWPLVGVPTRWEPYLNGVLAKGWDRVVPFPYDEVGYRPVVLWEWLAAVVARLDPLVGYLAGLARAWLYLGGPVWWFVFRGHHLDGLVAPGATAVAPVARFAGGTRRVRVQPGGWLAAGMGVHRRRHGRPKDTPGWGRISSAVPTWRWNRETYWADLRRGLDTEFPRNNRRPSRRGRRSTVVATRGGTYSVAPPSVPAAVVGLLYQVARVRPVGRSTPAGPTHQVGPPRPTGWLARPVGRASAPADRTPAERPRLFRRGRLPTRRVRPVHPDGTRPDHHRRGGVAPVGEVPCLVRSVRWAYRGHAVGVTLQHGWHLARYRATLAGVRPGGPSNPGRVITALAGVNYPGRIAFYSAAAATAATDNGYDAAGVNDEDNDDFVAPGVNYHEHVEEVDDHRDVLDEFEGVRYLSVEDDRLVGVTPGWGDHFVRRRLRAYERFGSLPPGGYAAAAPADYFGGDAALTGWSPAGGDHPAWAVTLLGPYYLARWGRRLTRGVCPAGWSPRRRRRRRRRAFPLGWSPAGWDPLWDEVVLAGWTVFDGGDPPDGYLADDLDVVEFGGHPGEGYRPAGAAAYRVGRLRPATAVALAGPVWSPPSGWNTRRYLLGEPLDAIVTDDPEGLFLEVLSRTYLDLYDLTFWVTDLENPGERDYDDLHEGSPFEEENQEVPRTRPGDYPGWVVAAAVAGASPGEGTAHGRGVRLSDTHDAVAESDRARPRPGRAELRRYYRAWRGIGSRARRAGGVPVLGGPLLGRGAAALAEAVPEADAPYYAVTSAEVDALAPAGLAGLEEGDWTDESLRLWALADVYWGDNPHGAATSH